MDDEWVELTGYNLESEECSYNFVRKSNVIAVAEGENSGLCALLLDVEGTKLVNGPFIMLAGEYDIVRDEITGGKWSRKAAWIQQRDDAQREANERFIAEQETHLVRTPINLPTDEDIKELVRKLRESD